MEKIFRDSSDVSPGIVAAASWAWRLIVIGMAVVLLYNGIMAFAEVTIPVAIAVLFAAALFPLRRLLVKIKIPNTLAAAICVLGFLLVLFLIMAVIGAMVVKELPQLGDKVLKDFADLSQWLSESPFSVNQSQITDWFNQLYHWANHSRSEIAAYAAGFGSKMGQILAGALITLVTTFFLLKDSKKFYQGLVSLCPAVYRSTFSYGIQEAWVSLVAFMRAAVTVAFLDAIGVLVACLILGTPLPWAVFAFTFVICFIPVIGAFSAGTVAALLTLVAQGPVSAVLMIVAVILVMNVEGNILQPLLLGRAVELHPLAVILGLTIGAGLAGITGALLAGPIMAFVTAYIRGHRKYRAGLANTTGETEIAIADDVKAVEENVLTVNNAKTVETKELDLEGLDSGEK